MSEMLLPEYTRQLMENYQSMFNQLASQLRWLYFDDAFRLVTRVGYLDDGWIRLRLDGHWEFTGELLRELSWTFYSIAEIGRKTDNLDVPLSTRASEATLSTIASLLPGLTAIDYNIISLDLSIARTDVLVASNVIFLMILDSTTSTAQYTLKLFSTTNKAITQDIAPPGTVIERLRRANVYVSNPAQASGTKLDLFIFMG